MSVNELILKYENEKAEIAEKINTLRTREEFVDVMLTELRGAVKSLGRRRAAKKPAGKAKPGRPKKRGGSTVREAIIKAVAGAGEPLPAGEIIKEASKLSGGAVASIRTQINTLTKEGQLAQVPYEGRGFKYALPEKAAKPAKKKAEPKQEGKADS